MKKIFIIDASNYIFRSYYAIRNMTNSKGIATNGLYGFVRSVQKIQKDFSPEYIAVVFDGPRNKASRLSIYPDYKGNREKAPDDLYPQISLAKQYCKAANLPFIEADGVEADDSMGAVARFATKEGIQAFLCSSDKDLCQLVDENTFIIHTHKDNQLLKRENIIDKYGITPEQFIDYLAIVGDTSDNIPGIKGFGPKTAETLLQEYGTLQKLLENAHLLKNKKRGQKILEEKENAEISYKLATIDIGIKIPEKLSFYEKKEEDRTQLAQFYEEMEFKTFLKDVMKEKLNSSEEQKNVSYRLINDASSLKGLVKSLIGQKSLCIDTETTGINPLVAEIIGIGIGYLEGVAYYIPFNGDIDNSIIIEELKPLFSAEIAFFGHNIKYDMHILNQIGLNIQKVDFDTLLASYVLESHLTKHSLDSLTEKYFHIQKMTFKEIIPKGKGKNFADVDLKTACSYCCSDVDYTIRLKELFEKRLHEKGLSDLYYNIELPLLPILLKMEQHGIYIDKQYLEEYSIELNERILSLSEKIYSEAGEEFNINSPKQLSSILFDKLSITPLKKTKEGYSTNAEVLFALKKIHPIINYIIEYRTLEKLRSTYVDALPKGINTKTKRIHCTFNQSGTVTGRLSSSNPNLQNIPVRSDEGKKVRKAFKPKKEDWVFLSLDYSQIELRILAHMAQEEKLLEAFKMNKDIHTDTASQVFNVPIDQVTKEMRHKAKAVNFGIIYGQKAFGLAKELDIHVKEAKDIIDIYFQKYPKIKSYIAHLTEEAKKNKKTVSLVGRERLLPDIDSKNFAVKSANERIAVNAPIQGSQSDIIKIAMIQIEEKLKKEELEAFLALQIHDELIFECPNKEIEKCIDIVKNTMESAYSLSVPLKVDVSIGKNWSEC